jgi:hypothetical protein
MDQNPYESPRASEPTKEQGLGDAGSIRQLLTEIRDAQFEMLQLNREAVQRTRRATGFSLALIPLMILLSLLPLLFIYYARAVPRPFPQIPVRAAPRVGP